ncbi:hypothetical protein PGT21_033860 [Puccinia graminis f. sp. tritici]|uniref:Uncharacterized protein n=1 Tax=Puccinia graminis f. sp. tritici TaxID=56615 RepID=A0A5B0LY87_PUCGR|nr:hypothetical protein PGT21_033860 [Puccinia graminis f. sp. tritici]
MMTYKPSPSDLVQMPALGSDWTKDESKRDKDWEGKDTLIDKTKWLDRKQKIRSKKQVVYTPLFSPKQASLPSSSRTCRRPATPSTDDRGSNSDSLSISNKECTRFSVDLNRPDWSTPPTRANFTECRSASLIQIDCFEIHSTYLSRKYSNHLFAFMLHLIADCPFALCGKTKMNLNDHWIED